MEIFSLVCNEASTLTSLVKQTAANNDVLRRTFTDTTDLSQTVLIIGRSLVLSGLSPLGQALAYLLLLHVESVRKAQKTPMQPAPLSARQQNNAAHLNCWLLVFINFFFSFRPNKVNSEGENESFAIQQKNEMLRH